MTPVGVGLGVVPVQDDVDVSLSPVDSIAEPEAGPVSSGPVLLKLREGQHSGRSSEQPTRGTASELPSGNVNVVNRAMAHLRQHQQTYIQE